VVLSYEVTIVDPLCADMAHEAQQGPRPIERKSLRCRHLRAMTSW
jgi:hypothetical protein